MIIIDKEKTFIGDINIFEITNKTYEKEYRQSAYDRYDDVYYLTINQSISFCCYDREEATIKYNKVLEAIIAKKEIVYLYNNESEK